MKKIACMILSVVLIFSSGVNIVLSDDNGYSADNYDEYYSIIVNAFQNTISDITIRLNDYNSTTYDLMKVISQLKAERPELYLCYGGFKANTEAHIGKQSYAIQHISFTYKRSASEMKNMKQCNSYDEFRDTVIAALSNFDDTLTVRVNNYDDTAYKSSVIGSIVESKCDLDYGYDGVSRSVYGSGKVRVITLKFRYRFTRKTMLDMKNKVDQKAKEIIANTINSSMSEYDKELAIHDYLVNNAKYDIANYKTDSVPPDEYTAYGVLVKGLGVCESYARATQKLLEMAGLECYIVVGTSKGNSHAWNIVRINGNYYQLDTTWDDPVTSNGSDVLRHKYFNITDLKMSNDHTWSSDNYPKCNSTVDAYKGTK